MSEVRIPLVNLPRMWERYGREWTEAMLEVLASGRLILGPSVAAFEEAYAAATGARFCVGVASGTDALHLALRAAGVGADDEVLTVANTFAATVEAILHAGARPVLVDAEDGSLLMDLDAVESTITERTRAVVPVHLSGRPIDLARLEKICQAHGLALVQDAAQAHGARSGGQPIGAAGTACYSFFPAKNLGALGDAGAVTTNDERIAERLRSLRDHGRRGKHSHEEIGFNSRLDAVQAAVLLRKLERLDDWNERRRSVAARYRARLENRVRIVDEPREGTGVFHHLVVRIADRDRIREELAGHGIETGIHYPEPVHRLAAFPFLSEGRFPVAERAAREILSLPIDPVITDDEIDLVATALLEASA